MQNIDWLIIRSIVSTYGGSAEELTQAAEIVKIYLSKSGLALKDSKVTGLVYAAHKDNSLPAANAPN